MTVGWQERRTISFVVKFKYGHHKFCEYGFMTISKNNLVSRIVDSLSSDQDKPFLLSPDESLNRGQFLAQVAKRQDQMKQAGIKIGAHILIFGGRGLAHWVDVVAVWGMGCVSIPINSTLGKEQRRSIIEIAQPDVAFAGSDIETDYPVEMVLLSEPDAISSEKDLTLEYRANGNQVASMVFTSGSTGGSKGVILKESAILGNGLSSLECMDLRSDDRLFMAIPFNFISAISYFVTSALRGATFFATEQKFFYADLFKALLKSEANCFGGSPIQLNWIAQCAGQEPISLRWVMSSGDRLSPEVIEKIKSTLPETLIFTVYGLTEVAGRFCFLSPDKLEGRAGSVGQPIKGLKVSVLNEDGHKTAPGEEGEIYISGSLLMNGYYRAPDATARSMSSRGFRSGDLGYLDEGGFLFITGRVDDVFKVNGQKVSSIPIADALMEMGLFKDVAVTSAEDTVLGTVPAVFYVLDDGANFDRKTVIERLRDSLPDAYIPRKFILVDRVPRTESGKIMRAELKKLARSL